MNAPDERPAPVTREEARRAVLFVSLAGELSRGETCTAALISELVARRTLMAKTAPDSFLRPYPTLRGVIWRQTPACACGAHRSPVGDVCERCGQAIPARWEIATGVAPG